jgi:2-polyprenyl-3-methyl-5-hydroxy-6-metoxy-1,4-benzoquinol methylase
VLKQLGNLWGRRTKSQARSRRSPSPVAFDIIAHMVGALPRFTEHRGHSKITPLQGLEKGKPEPFVEAFIRKVTERKPDARILDVGCGRGDRVAWLLDQGYDAWGSEISETYIARGNPFLAASGFGDDRLRLMTDIGQPFDQPFDLILSDQVVEHVHDIDLFAASLSAVSYPGTQGLHVFPASWRPIEPHMKAPLVHWLPKGPLRRAAIMAALRVGLAAEYFADMSAAERLAIYSTFSETETFYRSHQSLRIAFAQHGTICKTQQVAAEKLRMRLPWLPAAFTPLAAATYGWFASTYMSTKQT